MANDQGACRCCLKTGHLARDCRRRRCKVVGCDKFHHDLLHSHSGSLMALRPRKLTKSATELHDAIVQVGFSDTRSKERVFLQTAQGTLKSASGRRSKVTVLLDVGSQRSFIRKDIAEGLRLEGHSEKVIISTLGGKLSKIGKHKCVTFTLHGKGGGKGTVVSALCIDRICSVLESNPPLKEEWSHLQGVTLGDSFPRGPATVDVLISADYYHDFMKFGQLRGQVGQAIAVQSTLGWIVGGKSETSIHQREISALYATIEQQLDEDLRKFWEVESLSLEKSDTCESIGTDNANQQCGVAFDGERYTVSLPWKTEDLVLPDNYHMALQKLKQTEARLSRDASLNAAYCKEMNKYIRNGWVEKTNQKGLEGRTWYLPHHMVVRHDKTSTRYRIIFDTSCRYRGVSLNDALISGPRLQNDLLGIILRFRRFPIALQADISKMFMQVCLREEDRDVSRFLWRSSQTEDRPEVFRFTRICFGLNCSPFLALNVLRRHVQQQSPEYHEDVHDILKNMYVDDFVTSCNIIEDAHRIVKNTSHLLQTAGFRLTKWSSNVQESLEGLAREDVQCEEDVSKVLGMLWDRTSDNFTFKVPTGITLSSPGTKRELVSMAAKLYDPLGLLTPSTIRAKILFQRTWQSGTAWDETLPEDITREWWSWRLELTALPLVTLARRLIPMRKEDVATKDLHVFTDASEDAYGAVVYLRTTTKRGKNSMVIVASKSRVAPLKKLSVPRLELMGALIGARLVSYVKEVMELEIDAVHCWTDSKVALAWICSVTKQWKPFVKNRVEEIQSLTEPNSWRHCPGKENPADYATRGLALCKLVKERQWWNGPIRLESNEDAWPP
ncbi:RVT 1 and Peptidase A17 and DUF1758 domain contai ning protein [Trichuris trichiura]|uniref:RVT 1 and Peptidase A17 and DUF1758 domain contai ning protein n=1 Tax=Trichuris trichiura TaxID=36087 RepID=A0A077Z221_TRITR|nr:RVT 1 and Peptidase A17 and DUF1758 domain contai ning protein [Trichuris trichiura]